MANIKSRKKPELLAPAGNMDGFFGAVHAGADAVYLAGNQYGARAYADNFSEEELLACIRYAHLFQRKVYLAVNTLVKEAELEELPSFLAPLADAGLDGVIIQDFGVFHKVREHFPSLPLHVSTQMTVTGVYGALLMQEQGVVRIVPARELTLDEIRELKERTNLEIECFVHGAMCYCYSGQCLFSSILGGRSGNRGRCAQPCRLPYDNDQYPLSMKDLCSLDLLPELIDAGIDSFKIEGRMKKPEYAAGVTAVYRKYIDRYCETGECFIDKKDIQMLQNLYTRSAIQNGYFHKHNGAEMITRSCPAYNPTDEEVLSRIRKQYIDVRPRLKIGMIAYLNIGSPMVLTLYPADRPSLTVSVTGELVQPAANAPLAPESIRKQLSKLGETNFQLDPSINHGEPEISCDSNLFVSLKALNELRRRGILELEEVLLHG